MNLWNSDNCTDWAGALERYPEVVRDQKVNGLDELDSWLRNDFPKILTARRPPYITRSELERATIWKMKRGVWRERNRLLVIGNSPTLVKKTFLQALAAVPDVRRPVTLISSLAGVGPATASAVLCAYAPALFPFFDELVGQQIPDLGPVAFTASYYQRYAAALRERAARLNLQCKDREWTAQDVSQALWANSGGKAAHA